MKIKLMADYECSPLWWDNEPGKMGDIYPPDIGLNAALHADLFAWAARYDATLDQQYPPDSRFATKQELEEFVADGQLLAQRVCAALGPAFVVRYVPPEA